MTTKVCSIGTLTLLLDTLCPICNYRTESQVCILLPRLLAEEAVLPLPVWLKEQWLLLGCFPAQNYPFTFQTRTSASPRFNCCLYTIQTIAPNKHFTLTYMKYPLQPNLLAIFDNGQKKKILGSVFSLGPVVQIQSIFWDLENIASTLGLTYSCCNLRSIILSIRNNFLQPIATTYQNIAFNYKDE